MLDASDAYIGTLERRRTAVHKFLVIAEMSVQEAIGEGKLSCKIEIETASDVLTLLRHQLRARGYSLHQWEQASKKGEPQRTDLHISWSQEPCVLPLLKGDAIHG